MSCVSCVDGRRAYGSRTTKAVVDDRESELGHLKDVYESFRGKSPVRI